MMDKKQSFKDELKERERYEIDEHIDFIEQSKIDVDTIPNVKADMMYGKEIELRILRAEVLVYVNLISDCNKKLAELREKVSKLEG